MATIPQVRKATLWILEGWRPYAVIGLLFVSVVIMDVYWPRQWSMYREVLIIGLLLSAISGYAHKGVISGILLGSTPYIASSLGSRTVRYIQITGEFPAEQLINALGVIPYALSLGIATYVIGYLLKEFIDYLQNRRQSRLVA